MKTIVIIWIVLLAISIALSVVFFVLNRQADGGAVADVTAEADS